MYVQLPILGINTLDTFGSDLNFYAEIWYDKKGGLKQLKLKMPNCRLYQLFKHRAANLQHSNSNFQKLFCKVLRTANLSLPQRATEMRERTSMA